jgi:hypothetical protein
VEKATANKPKPKPIKIDFDEDLDGKYIKTNWINQLKNTLL